MPYVYLAANVGLANDVYTTVMDLTLDPGIWIILAHVMVRNNTSGANNFCIIASRIWDGESEFFAGDEATEGAITIGDATWQEFQVVLMGVADLSAAVVPTTLYLQCLPKTVMGTPSCAALTESFWQNALAASWFIATPFGGEGFVSFPPSPSSFTDGTAHAGLTGTGSISIAAPVNGIRVTATTIPLGWGSTWGNPNHYIPAYGELVWGDGTNVQTTELLHETPLISWSPARWCNEVRYSLKSGVTVTITELEGT